MKHAKNAKVPLIEMLKGADYGTMVDKERFIRFSGDIDTEVYLQYLAGDISDNETVMTLFDDHDSHLELSILDFIDADIKSDTCVEMNGHEYEYFELTPINICCATTHTLPSFFIPAGLFLLVVISLIVWRL